MKTFFLQTGLGDIPTIKPWHDGSLWEMVCSTVSVIGELLLVVIGIMVVMALNDLVKTLKKRWKV